MILSTIAEVERVLRCVTFAPSCVDMGWEWEAIEAFSDDGDGAPPIGFLLRTTFQRPDRDTGAIERGFGRWWHVPPNPTPSGIVKTAFAAAKLILEHELMESFRYAEVRLFDPHHDIGDLAAAVRHHREQRAPIKESP